MIYGLYLSATGVQTSAHRQDTIANNLANAETVGFKKDLSLFRQRLTEAQERRISPGSRRPYGPAFPAAPTNPLLEPIGGGHDFHPTLIDTAQGELEPTGSPLDLAIEGGGYFAVVDSAGDTRLTRNGQFAVDAQGNLTLANAKGEKVLDVQRRPIRLEGGAADVYVGKDGTITQRGRPVARVGLFDAADRRRLVKHGGTLLSFGDQQLTPVPAGASAIHGGFVERANVDPATELAALMDTQRQLEANANMIRYQDQTLAKLVNEVGKIG
jgi:flagellar basal body rod protein FlgG